MWTTNFCNFPLTIFEVWLLTQVRRLKWWKQNYRGLVCHTLGSSKQQDLSCRRLRVWNQGPSLWRPWETLSPCLSLVLEAPGLMGSQHLSLVSTVTGPSSVSECHTYLSLLSYLSYRIPDIGFKAHFRTRMTPFLQIPGRIIPTKLSFTSKFLFIGIGSQDLTTVTF